MNLFGSAATSYSQGTSNEKADHDGKWLLPADWRIRCVKCLKCNRDTVAIFAVGREVVIDVDEAYKQKGVRKGCRVTIEHSKNCGKVRKSVRRGR